MEHNSQLRRDIGFIHTLSEIVDLPKRLGSESVSNSITVGLNGICTFRRGVSFFHLVQVSDFVVGTFDTPNRAVPGDGDIPLERLIGEILEAGYQGPFEVELVGPRIDEEGYSSAIVRSVRWLSDVLERLGA